MDTKNKELLLKDLNARLPYGVKIELTWWVMGEGTFINITIEPDHIEQLINDEYGDTEIKPYLRSMSSMTEEEAKEIYLLLFKVERIGIPDICKEQNAISLLYYWLNTHHFDYRGLIPKGLAIEVTEENNPYQLD